MACLKVDKFFPQMADASRAQGFPGPPELPVSRLHPPTAAPTPILKSRGVKRPRPSKVTWAAGPKFCKVRLYVAEDAPYLAGVDTQDRLKAKVAKMIHAPVSVSTRGASSAFRHGERNQMPRRLVDDATIKAVVAQVAWREPPVLSLQASWLVKAGEGSEEVKEQKNRQIRVLEAVYPRPSCIPSSPPEPEEAPSNVVQDDAILLIPLFQDAPETLKSGLPPMTRLGSEGPSVEHVPGAWPRPMADPANLAFPSISAPRSTTSLPFQQQETKLAVSTSDSVDSFVAQAVEKSREAGSLIDIDLLLEILKNPSLLNILKNPSLMQFLAGKNCTLPAPNCPGPLTSGSSFLPQCVQASSVGFLHSAPAFVHHPPLPPAYPARVQNWQTTTRW